MINGMAAVVRPPSRGREPVWLRGWQGQAQKSRAAFGSVTADQNSVTWPSRLWVTFATGTSIDLPLRVAVSVASTTVCSSLARTSWTSSRNVPPVFLRQAAEEAEHLIPAVIVAVERPTGLYVPDGVVGEQLGKRRQVTLGERFVASASELDIRMLGHGASPARFLNCADP
jgi:hypothetical protein